MKDATFLMGNWYLFVAVLAMATLTAAAAARFFAMPSAEQREKVKEWLLLAVTEAEAELGSGTGQLKLRYVYDLFLQRSEQNLKQLVIRFLFRHIAAEQELIRAEDLRHILDPIVFDRVAFMFIVILFIFIFLFWTCKHTKKQIIKDTFLL